MKKSYPIRLAKGLALIDDFFDGKRDRWDLLTLTDHFAKLFGYWKKTRVLCIAYRQLDEQKQNSTYLSKKRNHNT